MQSKLPVTRLQTEQWYVASIVVTDAEYRCLSGIQLPTQDKDAPIYFIRLVDLFIALSGDALPIKAELIVHPSCPLYILNQKCEAFVQIKSIADHPANALYARYDHCYFIMRAWLHQMVTARETAKKCVPRWLKGVESMTFDTIDDGSLIKHVHLLERACFRVAHLDAAENVSLAMPEYQRAVAEIARFLYEDGVTFDTMKHTMHPLSYLHAIPFASFILEGILLFMTKRFEMIRRPFWQKCILLPMLEKHIKDKDLELEPAALERWVQEKKKQEAARSRQKSTQESKQ